ncbi:MAG: hypothetical protein SO238_03180 [Treponema sp.]|nr:hypothetical protein [Treponema sp.]
MAKALKNTQNYNSFMATFLRFCEPGEGYGTPAEQPTAAERSEARTVRVTEAWNSPVLTAKQSKRPINV